MRTPRRRRVMPAALLFGLLSVLLVLVAAAVPAEGAGPDAVDVRPSDVRPSSAQAGAPGPSPPAAGASSGDARFTWPVGTAASPPEIRHEFDAPDEPWLSGHRGVDLAAPVGTAVRASGPGRVVFAGMVAGRPVVSVQHATGLRTTYEPLEPAVAAGEHVSRGDRLGRLTATGSHCALSCLHWGARTGPRSYIDPLLLLREEVQVRLYPVQG